jgi:hypothetical protein
MGFRYETVTKTLPQSQLLPAQLQAVPVEFGTFSDPGNYL